MGPTILTVPRVLRRIFAEAGRDQARDLPLIRLDPQWRCFFEDGTQIDLLEDVDADGAQHGRFAPGSDRARATERFQEISQNLHAHLRALLLLEVGRGPARHDGLEAPTCSADTLKDVLALRMGKTVAKVIRGHVPDARLAQMLDHFCQYVGSSPYWRPPCSAASATCRRARASGIPMGGTRAVAEGLAKLAGELGADLRTGVGGDRPRRARQTAARARRASRTARRIPCDAVISNMDADPHLQGAGRRQDGAQATSARASSRPAPASCSISG